MGFHDFGFELNVLGAEIFVGAIIDVNCNIVRTSILVHISLRRTGPHSFLREESFQFCRGLLDPSGRVVRIGWWVKHVRLHVPLNHSFTFLVPVESVGFAGLHDGVKFVLDVDLRRAHAAVQISHTLLGLGLVVVEIFFFRHTLRENVLD